MNIYTEANYMCAMTLCSMMYSSPNAQRPMQQPFKLQATSSFQVSKWASTCHCAGLDATSPPQSATTAGIAGGRGCQFSSPTKCPTWFKCLGAQLCKRQHPQMRGTTPRTTSSRISTRSAMYEPFHQLVTQQSSPASSLTILRSRRPDQTSTYWDSTTVIRTSSMRSSCSRTAKTGTGGVDRYLSTSSPTSRSTSATARITLRTRRAPGGPSW